MRSFYGVSIDQIGETVSYAEAVLLTRMLLKNPNSWLLTALAGWEYPVSREWTVAVHTYDLLAQVNSGKGKPKPYPTPWPDRSKTKLGAKHQPAGHVLERLKKMNTNLEA
jgi:hypothetical protein